MSETMTAADFTAWKARQPLAFELVDICPVRLPNERQGPFRVAQVLQVAGQVLADEAAANVWMVTPHAELGGLEPEALAADSEDGCQVVLRELVRLGRLREASHG